MHFEMKGGEQRSEAGSAQLHTASEIHVQEQAPQEATPRPQQRVWDCEHEPAERLPGLAPRDHTANNRFLSRLSAPSHKARTRM